MTLKTGQTVFRAIPQRAITLADGALRALHAVLLFQRAVLRLTAVFSSYTLRFTAVGCSASVLTFFQALLVFFFLTC